jgi:hypothetical protein
MLGGAAHKRPVLTYSYTLWAPSNERALALVAFLLPLHL